MVDPIPSKAEGLCTKELELVFGDLIGSKEVAALGKKRYVALFRVDVSRFIWVDILVHYEDIAWALDRFLADMRTNRVPKIIRLNGGGELESLFSDFAIVTGSSRGSQLQIPPESMDMWSVFWRCLTQLSLLLVLRLCLVILDC